MTDIFSTNVKPVPSSGQRPSPVKAGNPLRIAAFKVSEDAPAPLANATKTISAADSGHHGLSEDEMEADAAPLQSSASTHNTLAGSPPAASHAPRQDESLSIGHSTTDRSFHSAREEITKKVVNNPTEDVKELEKVTPAVLEIDPIQSLPQHTKTDMMKMNAPDKEADEDLAVEDSRSSSQESTPARQLVRKSSLTFAALPAREPITTKKSIGPRTSRTSNIDQIKVPVPPNSFLGRLTGGKSLGGFRQTDTKTNASDDDDDETDRQPLAREESDNDSKMTRLHNKSSTQRLHERINLLGKSQPPRPTKSIPAAAAAIQPQYLDIQRPNQDKQAPQNTQLNTLTSNEDDEDDWIQPPKTRNSTHARPPLAKSISADVINNTRGKQSLGQQQPGLGQEGNAEYCTAQDAQAVVPPSKHVQVASASRSLIPEDHGVAQNGGASDSLYPELGKPTDASTTPYGTPSSKRYVDGPLSASKSKLQSIMKTARGLFSSSAGVSAQAKMETMFPSIAPRQHAKQPENSTQNPRSTAPRLDQRQILTDQAQESKVRQSTPVIIEARKTRSSTEKEERMKEKATAERLQFESENEKVNERETNAQAQAHASILTKVPPNMEERPIRQSPRKTQNHEATKMENDNQVQGQPFQVQRPKDARRPIKPAKDNTSNPKGPPVNIRIGMPSVRKPLTNAALSSSLQDSLPASQPKQGPVMKKASNAFLQSSVSNSNLKSAGAAAKPRALIAAERKKEQVCFSASHFLFQT